MKKIILSSALFSTMSFANVYSVDQLQNLTNSSPLSNINAATPAAYADNKLGISVGLKLSGNIEIGEADFVDDLEDLIDDLDRDDIGLDEANTIITRFNSVLSSAETSGYVSSNIGGALPFSMYYQTEKYGTFTLKNSFNAYARLSVLNSPLQYNPISQELETSSSIYIKSAEHANISLGYSNLAYKNEHGQLYFGTHINVTQVNLSKQVLMLNSVDSDEGLDNAVMDTFEDNRVSSTAFTIDAGVIWKAKHYTIGLNGANLNTPTFDYGELGKNCSTKTGVSVDNCFAAQSFSDKIALNERFEMTPQISATLALHNEKNTYGIEVAGQTKTNTFTGEEVQWVSAKTHYTPEGFWFPSVSFAVHKNLVGSELSYASIGLSLFKIAHFNVGTSLDNTTIDSQEIPRGAFASLKVGIEF